MIILSPDSVLKLSRKRETARQTHPKWGSGSFQWRFTLTMSHPPTPNAGAGSEAFLRVRSRFLGIFVITFGRFLIDGLELRRVGVPASRDDVRLPVGALSHRFLKRRHEWSPGQPASKRPEAAPTQEKRTEKKEQQPKPDSPGPGGACHCSSHSSRG